MDYKISRDTSTRASIRLTFSVGYPSLAWHGRGQLAGSPTLKRSLSLIEARVLRKFPNAPIKTWHAN